MPEPRDRIRLLAATLVMLMMAAGAQASTPATTWEPYGESENAVHYYDTVSVRVEGSRRRVWRLFDLRARAENGVQSGMALVEIDCRESAFRYLRTIYFDGPKGHGKYLGGASDLQFDPIGPGSMIGQLARRLC
ncbi:surface-adhesin E family protein [Ramlibacter sp.]|uniref:surface-adhesin E family protein n=1 Tax=Ramlibacter sp. TaxID=1917967 RepID=UPI0035B37EFE